MKDCHLSFSVIPNLHTFIHFQNTGEDIFNENLRDFCPSIDSLHNYHFDASGSCRYHKTNPNESSGLVQNFLKRLDRLYNEQTDYLFTFNIYHR